MSSATTFVYSIIPNYKQSSISQQFRLSRNPTGMWRNLAKRAVSSRRLMKSWENSIFQENIRPCELTSFRPDSEVSFQVNDFGKSHFRCFSDTSIGFSGMLSHPKSYASVAEAISTTDTEEDTVVDEIQGLLKEVSKEDQENFRSKQQRKRPKMVAGLGIGKYHILKRRQMKIETEAWEQAAKEYKELLADMCEHKLAPNLPYMKSLFLGWFEPMLDCIASEQELCKKGKSRAAYAPYFDQLPAEMMAVITMHKLMGLLMTAGDEGGARVVQAACHIGEAIEHEVRIYNFLEKTRKKASQDKEKEGGEPDLAAKEQAKLRNKVTNLMKKQKLKQVRHIVRGHDDIKPWGQDAQAKVGSRLIELLLQSAYIQPPVDQLADGPPDIRPAFQHTLRTVKKDGQKVSRRYGMIECDSLVRQGMERTARHMVIPYMPMLIPPANWIGYGI